MLRVVFAEDNYLIREGTAALLSEAGDVRIVGTAASLDELLAAVEEHEPKLALSEEPDVHRRVMAVLAFLREQQHADIIAPGACPARPRITVQA